MNLKMIVVCPCGTKLRVAMSAYAKMRCPKCHLMLATEIERQAARNSKAILDITAIMLNDRMNSKRWTGHDEMIAHILAKHEVESHGGVFEALKPVVVEPMNRPISFEDEIAPVLPVMPVPSNNGNAPAPADTSWNAPAFASATPPPPPPVVRKIRTKVKTKKSKRGRR